MAQDELRACGRAENRSVTIHLPLHAVPHRICAMPRRTLEVLQDRVEPKPFPAVERILRRELGAGADELFAEFEREATAAASLAQVLPRQPTIGSNLVFKSMNTWSHKLNFEI